MKKVKKKKKIIKTVNKKIIKKVVDKIVEKNKNTQKRKQKIKKDNEVRFKSFLKLRGYNNKQINIIYKKSNPVFVKKIATYEKFETIVFKRDKKHKRFTYIDNKKLYYNQYLKRKQSELYWERIRGLSDWLGIPISESREYFKQAKSEISILRKKRNRIRTSIKRIKDEKIRIKIKQDLDFMRMQIMELQLDFDYALKGNIINK